MATEKEIVMTTDSMTTTAQDRNAYTTTQLVALGCLVGATCLMTIGGNLVVLLSFLLQRSLRQPTNYFIASLAVSDLIIGCVSMPFYSVYLLTGQHWPLGETLCDLWLSVDYTVCLCSIYTVLCITVDRFCSVRIPARYRNWRTETKVKVVIGVVWVVPTAVFFTTIFGWQYMVGGGRTVPPGKCYVQYMQWEVFNAALQIGYFWVTLIVMCALYVAIYRSALQLQTKSRLKGKGRSSSSSSSSRRQVRESAETEQQTTADEETAVTTNDRRPVTSSSVEKDEKFSPSLSSETDLSSPIALRKQRSQEQGRFDPDQASAAAAAAAAAAVEALDDDASDLVNETPNKAFEKSNATASDDVTFSSSRDDVTQRQTDGHSRSTEAGQDEAGKSGIQSGVWVAKWDPSEEAKREAGEVRWHVDGASRGKQPSAAEKKRGVETTEGSSDDLEESRQSVKGQRSTKSDEGDRSTSENRTSAQRNSENESLFGAASVWFRHLRCSVETALEQKRKRRRRGSSSGRREGRARKALRTITLILGAFVLCWTPWHILSLTIGFCPECVLPILYDVSYWLCYLNSPVNPFCYAFANRQFKKTFVRIVRMDWRRL